MTTKPGISDVIKRLSTTTKVLFGTFSGMVATTIVHPLDVIKVRLQINERSCNTRELARMIVKCEGVGALYSGMTAGLMRQATYTTTRLTVYHLLNQHVKRYYNVPSLSTKDKVTVGVFAGLAGALAGNPSEVALVRMMADGPMDPCGRCRSRKRYKGVFHAMYKISREDGVLTLWRGGILTMWRSIFVSIAQIGTYAEVNELMGQRNVMNDFNLHVFTSIVASFVTTIVSLPVDLIKTRYQVVTTTRTEKEILKDIINRKGIKYLWKGFTPYFVRMSIHTVATLVIFEELVEYFYIKG